MQADFQVEMEQGDWRYGHHELEMPRITTAAHFVREKGAIVDDVMRSGSDVLFFFFFFFFCPF